MPLQSQEYICISTVVVRHIYGKDPDYEFVQELGHGGFGEVAKVMKKAAREVSYRAKLCRVLELLLLTAGTFS